jgi:CRISPR-associated endonuclease/helicase Cas3
MNGAEHDIDWSLTTWEGSRRAQLRHALKLSLRERLQAAEGLADVARRFREMRARGQFRTVRSDAARPRPGRALIAREPPSPYAREADGSAGRGPGASTRYIETRLGILSYTQLAPHLARNVLSLEKRIEDGEFEKSALDDALLLQFHSVICGDLVLQLAGWRRTNVAVGEHEPPPFFQVPMLVREYGRDLQVQLSAAGSADHLLLESLAFAEGRLLSIHPFAGFNGRVTRVWLREILRRLDLPPVQLAPSEEAARIEYLRALRAADRNDWRPLIGIWRRRFESQ